MSELKQEIVYIKPDKIRFRSEKGNVIRRPSKRRQIRKELRLSQDNIAEALDYLGGENILQRFRPV